MKIKLLSTIIAIAAFSTLITGCVYSNTTVNINADGSGRVQNVTGALKGIYSKLGKSPKDFTSNQNEYYEITYGGKKYLVGDFDDAYVNPEEINSSSGVGAISTEIGPVDLISVNNGFKLNLKLSDDLTSGMKPEHVFPDLENISDDTLEGMTLYDLIAQNVEGLSLRATFNMPYEVKQVKGTTAGVTVKGKTISLDYLKMINSGTHEWEFDSIKKIKQSNFSDVPKNAPYFDAVNSVVDGGIMSGFADGTFKPDKYVTMDELAKIVTIGLGQKIANDKTYWARNHIKFMQKYNFFLSKASVTSKNWSVPTTREQVIYALTYGDNTQGAYEIIQSNDIKDWASIDPKMRDMILWGYNTGVVDIETNEYLKPKSNVTRAEIAQILYDMHWTVPKSELATGFLQDFLLYSE